MKIEKFNVKIFLLFFMVFSLAQTTQAKSTKKKKNFLASKINDAVERSNQEQKRIKVRFDEEADQRISSWTEEDIEAIEIKHGASTLRGANLGKPDFTLDQGGEDQSGLNQLRSDVEEEPIHIDFDEELREVSSTKD